MLPVMMLGMVTASAKPVEKRKEEKVAPQLTESRKLLLEGRKQ